MYTNIHQYTLINISQYTKSIFTDKVIQLFWLYTIYCVLHTEISMVKLVRIQTTGVELCQL